uniref:Uncharacterized protein n=1 Tax=Stomoxys calcitrans TaxID=35570 RepID=A0A1I8NY52_STOCA
MLSLKKTVSDKHRVIVQLNKSGSHNASHSKLTLVQIRAAPDITDSCIALDYNTLQVNKKSSTTKILQLPSSKETLKFDCVANGFDANTKSEMSLMIDQILLNHRNCCMIRCVAVLESSAAVLNHLLVCEVDKRLQMAQLTLRSVECEYFDIRKFDIVNLLGGRHHKSQKFLSTMDLQRWLKGEYQQLVAKCQGHECLDFVFTFSGKRGVMHQVKFSYMQLIAAKLDSQDKLALRQSLEDITIRPRGIQSSMLLDTLRDYLLPHQEMQIWMFFEIPVRQRPTNSGSDEIMTDMLKFAKAAYAGFHASSAGTNGESCCYN